tara:strand:+ start:1328 stop:1663 length:336 start_codon:yes stop_codon:yes gene_type:complete
MSEQLPYVLRRYDKDPNGQWIVNTYSEVLHSQPVELNGVIAATLFSNDIHAFNRAQKFGWTDSTAEYHASKQNNDSSSSDAVEMVAEKSSPPTKSSKSAKKSTRGRPKKNK